jgi:uncharacterized protein DUF402
MWSRGDVVALRDIWFDAVWRAVPGITLEDNGERSVFYVPAGSDAAYPVDAEGNEIRMPRREFERGSRRTKRPIVVVCDEGAPWTIWLFFGDAGFDHWYVNFERYLGRSRIAYDSVDHKLDLIVDRDGALRWKDEEELERAGQLGLVDVATVRRDAELAVRQTPWPTGWEGYRPAEASGPIDLPPGWDAYPAAG